MSTFWPKKYKTRDEFIEKHLGPKVAKAAAESFNLQETIKKVLPQHWKGLKQKTFREWVSRARELGFDIPNLQHTYKRQPRADRPDLDNIRFPFTRKGELRKAKRFIITSALNNTVIDLELWETIKFYANINKAMIIVVPSRFKNPTSQQEASNQDSYWWPQEVLPYLTDDLLELHEHLHLMAHIRVQATASDPLSGTQELSKGASAIFGHAQLAMGMVPTPQNSMPKVLWTTCSVSEPSYSDTKKGIQARFHHSKGALIVELDGPRFYARPVLWDGQGFQDHYDYYGCNGVEDCYVEGRVAEALVLGDEHVDFNDPKCRAATYDNKDSIVNICLPRILVRHDVLDAYSISHHHEKNAVTKIAKAENNRNRLADELERLRTFIDETTPSWAENIIVPSNHHDHVLKWMNRASPLEDPENARVFVELWHGLLPTIQLGPHGTECGDPMALWLAGRLTAKTTFLGRHDSHQIAGIEVSQHGDQGINGSKGSIKQYARLGAKTVTGHSHSPGISGGAYAVGTSTGRLEYESGPGTHAQCHCLIFSNGKRQPIFVISGHWRKHD